MWARKTFTFAAGTVTGNLSEVGIGRFADNVSLASKSLIKDNGTPITLTVGPTDVLTVTYEFRRYYPENDVLATVDIGGQSYDVVIRPAGAASDTNSNTAFSTFIYPTAYSGDIGIQTGYPTGSSSDGSYSSAAYVSDSHERNFTCTWGLNQGNFAGGIKSVLVRTTFGNYQCSFTPPIPKPTTSPLKSLALNFTFSWARRP